MAELEIKPTAAMRLRVAGVIAAGLAGIAILSFLLAGGGSELFTRKTTLTTYMPDATGLTTDSVVRLNGIQIGKVGKVEISESLDPQRAVRVSMRVLARYLKSVPNDSLTDISEDTLVGDQFVDIQEGKSRIAIGEDGVLQSEPLKKAIDRADLMATVQRNLTQVDELLADISSGETKTGKFVLGSAEYDGIVSRIGDFDRTMRAVITPRSALGQAFYSLAGYDYIRDRVLRVDQTLASIQAGEGAAGRLFASDEQYNALVAQLRDLRSTLADANAGRGRFAGLTHDDESYRRISRMLASTNALLASLNGGEGRFGELLANPQLYESLNGSLRGIEALLRDLREHPRKYLRIKIF